MIASGHITRIVAAVMAIAVCLCFCAAAFSESITAAAGGSGVTMEYETALFDTGEVLSVNILMDEADWADMLENAISEEYYSCTVEIGGKTFYQVGIRPKGNTSLSNIANDPTTDRYSFKLEFDHYVECQTCFGLDKLVLNNNYADATNMKEALIYDMYQYHTHQLELPTLAFGRRVVFRVGHSARLPMLVSLEFRQPQFRTNLVVANAQLLNLFVCHMHLPTGFKIYAVDDAVGVDMFAVDMGADQHLATLKISRQLTSCLMCCARVDVRAFREALHHVIKHHAALLVVQQLRTQKFVERRFRLAADTADELPSVPERFAELGNVAHDAFHAAARLRPLFVVHEMDDCDFATPPSCISRRAVLILANSCAAESRLANCTLPIFASTVS